MPLHHRKIPMKYRLALLLAASTPAFAGPITWTPIPTPQAPVYIQQVQPDYSQAFDFSTLINAMDRYRAQLKPSAPATPPVHDGPVTREQSPQGVWQTCRTYGENKFCN